MDLPTKKLTNSQLACKAAVIVPAYNAVSTLAGCLASLTNQALPAGLKLEIIVVDDGSTDGTCEVALRYSSRGVKLVRIPHSGAAAARNRGVSTVNTDCEFILFTDADCEPAPDWAGQLVETLTGTGEGTIGVKGVYRTRQSSLVALFVQSELEERYARFRSGHTRPGFCDTYSAAFYYKVLKHYPFDEELPGAVVEDAELGWRLGQAGYKFGFAPKAVVYHQHVAELKKYFLRKFQIARYRVLLYHRYPGRLVADPHTSKAAKTQMALLAFGVLLSGLGLGVLLLKVRAKLARLALLSGAVILVLLELSFWPFVRRSRLPWGWSLLLLNTRTAAFCAGALCGTGQLLIEKWI